mmetsp:Transcript_3270/g.5742  ORF Transcript_3270/g.5742 Transcript_3270/m.5742 type:complete len:132 (-) Transcript_3270:8-403(-)
MSWMFLGFKSWQNVILKMKDPWYAMRWSTGVCLTAWGAGQVIKFGTDIGSRDTQKELETEIIPKDPAAQEYVQNSRDALATLFAELKGEPIEEGYKRVPLPGIEWHPAIKEREERERKEREAKLKQIRNTE